MKAQADRAKEFLRSLSEISAVSGYEYRLIEQIEAGFRLIADEITQDSFHHVYARKKGSKGTSKIMLAAHSDEIGLMITDVDQRGFLHFTQIAGVDAKTLLGQEVTVHGEQDVPGVIASVPPRALTSDNGQSIIKMEDMRIDVGMPQAQIREVIDVGATVTIRRKMTELLNNRVAGKAFDDRAGIVAMAVCFEELEKMHHLHDVMAVATVQEEVGIRGAGISAYRLAPDLAIAIDVTHASTSDHKNPSIELGKGPAVAIGPNIHPAIAKKLGEIAQENRLSYQFDPNPGATGTDARVIQITQAGIPTGLLSIPLRYMHTSVEMLEMKDVVNTGKLLAYFIASLPEDLEDFLCY
ncbi:MAG: M20/M25/M40 family metallo-hydrolase [Peptococcaceae bacterium]|jgi:endoglucanase|nr:M20/M25/M40 family metallo-hydrolase [Peptococcaceae bacterium]